MEFDSFRGNIGAGQIYLKTCKGVVIKGKINGGPSSGQSIIGRGT
jgi:hypothetical protein